MGGRTSASRALSILLSVSASGWGCAGAAASRGPEEPPPRGPPPHVTVIATPHLALRASLFLAFAARLTSESRAPDDAPAGRVAAARAWERARASRLNEARRALREIAECETRECADRALGPLVGHDALAAALADYRAREWAHDSNLMRRTISQVDLAADEGWVELLARARSALSVKAAEVRVTVDVVAVDTYLDERDLMPLALAPTSPCARALHSPPSDEDHARLTGCALALALARDQPSSAFPSVDARRWQLLAVLSAAVVARARDRRAASPFLSRAERLDGETLERLIARWPARMRGAPAAELLDAFDEP